MLVTLALIGSVVTAVGPVAGASGTAMESSTSAQDTAQLRVVHASPDAPAVDVTVDNETVLSNVSFGAVSDYLHVAAGPHQVRIAAADDPSTVVFDDEVTLAAGTMTTLAATGELSQGAGSAFAPVAYSDDAFAPAPDEAAVRVVHLSPDAPAVDVTTANGTVVLADDLTFRNASDYLTVPAGDYTVAIRAATETNDGPVVTTVNLSLASGAAYSALAMGYLDPAAAPANTSFRVQPAEDGVRALTFPTGAPGDVTQQSTALRVMHASPDAPPVDVYVDGQRVLRYVTFASASQYLALDAGTYNVTVTAASQPDTVVFEDDVTVEARTVTTLTAAGEISAGAETSFAPVGLSDDAVTPGTDEAAVRVAHLSPDAPAVDVTVGNGSAVLAENVSFGEASDYVAVPAGDYTVEIRAATASNNGTVVTTVDLSLAGGTAYTAAAVGYLDPGAAPTPTGFGVVPVMDATTTLHTPSDVPVVGPTQQSAYLRAVHASPDAPAVDVRVDNETVLSNVSFGDVSDYLHLQAGTYDVTIAAAADPSTVVFDDPVTLEARTVTTLAATGEISTNASTSFAPVAFSDDAYVPAAGDAALRLVHLSPDAPTVDITAGNGSVVLADNLSFRDATPYATVPAGNYTVEIRGATATNDGPVVTTVNVSLASETVVTAMAVGYLDPAAAPANTSFAVLPMEDAALLVRLPPTALAMDG